MAPLLPRLAISPLVWAVPVTIIVILSAPAWLTWPFLSESRQQAVLQMVDALARWMRSDPVLIGQELESTARDSHA
jgi:hypothetical protein